jgi:hypothetical protein
MTTNACDLAITALCNVFISFHLVAHIINFRRCILLIVVYPFHTRWMCAVLSTDEREPSGFWWAPKEGGGAARRKLDLFCLRSFSAAACSFWASIQSM